MRPTSISKRYAKALLKICEGNIDVARRRLNILKNLEEIYSIPKVRKILTTPAIPKNTRNQIIWDLLNYCDGASDQELKMYMTTLIEANRIYMLREIIHDYELLLDQISNTVRIKAIFAVEPSDTSLKVLQEILENKLLSKNVIIDYEVDPSIIGGFILNVGKFLIDLSIKTKLKSLFEYIANN